MSTPRSISKVITARQQAEGVGARVRRSIGTMNQRSFNPFLMFDCFSSIGEKRMGKFPEHPHQGQETITYLVSGALAHEDLTGGMGILYSGDLQFMTAGKGIVHSEMPLPSESEVPTIVLQLWIDLPDSLKDCEPSYRIMREWEIPEIVVDNNRVTIRIISGTSYGQQYIHKLASVPVNYYHYKVKAGGEFKQELESGFNYFLNVFKGNNLELNETIEISQNQNVFFGKDGDYITGKNVNMVDTEANEIEFVIIGAKMLHQEVISYGPFVADSMEKIEKAIIDYQYRQNGFEKRKTWRTLLSNGVTEEMIQGPLNGNLEKRAAQRKAYFEQKNVSHA
ncbi:Pirin-like-family protein, putative [Candida maltosa Xu316]|uniref:Pirin-like-family protein, putative n=1 Tax=Candida maltosa (strain Xu316) TaxID=1245528 RepID=M3HKC0_CANMX|nr:Pirin-like-family protein, putative [Candida maltosa Xu316]